MSTDTATQTADTRTHPAEDAPDRTRPRPPIDPKRAEHEAALKRELERIPPGEDPDLWEGDTRLD